MMLITGCGSPKPSIPQSAASSELSCPPAGSAAGDWLETEEPSLWLKNNGVEKVGGAIEERYLVQFALELAKMPARVRAFLAKSNVAMHIFQGHGVTDDPSWPAGLTTTFDGRLWSEVPGAGGNPTRIVVNRLYEGHGSVNLVLHERAHSFDEAAVGGAISESSAWAAQAASAEAKLLFSKVCFAYCSDHPNEAFAESYATYYACERTNAWMKRNAPELSAFIERVSENPGS